MQSLICKTQATNHDKSVLSLVHVGGGGETKWGGAEDNESHLKLFIKTSPKNTVFLVIAKLGGNFFGQSFNSYYPSKSMYISLFISFWRYILKDMINDL